MRRMFRRWMSLLICLFLPSMMISFLYHKHEILQKKIAHSLQSGQRLFPKSLPAVDTSSSVWQRFVYSTPFYRVERDVDEQILLPMAIPVMTSEQTLRSKMPTKQTITTRAAVVTAERKESVPIGNDVSRTVNSPVVEKKRPSKRSRKTKKRIPVKPQALPQHVNLNVPVKSVEVVEKSDDKQLKPTSAPIVEAPRSAGSIKEVAKESKIHSGSILAKPVESADTVQNTVATTLATLVVRPTSKIRAIAPNIGKDDLDITSGNRSSLNGLMQTSDQEKLSDQKIQSAVSSKRKSKRRQVKPKKTKVTNIVKVVNNEEKLDEGTPDSILETVKNETNNRDEVVQMTQEQITHENNVPEKPPSRKDDKKRKRDRKSRTRRGKPQPKEVGPDVPVTLPLRFNLHDSNSNSAVILASTNNAFLNFTDNWLESVKRAGIKSGVTLVAEDREAFNYLKNRTDIELNVVLNDVSESPGERLLFDSPAYKQLVNKRPSYILQLLSNGYDVLFSDVDIVWLKNPLLYFVNDTNDIWLQEDLHEPTVYCAGFTFYRSTPATIALVTEWVQTLALHPTYPDQRVLNGLLKKKRWQGDNIKRAVMDLRLFPSGHLYFDPEWREANKDVEQVMVHNNWIVGHDRKVERFKNEGLWYLDDKGTENSQNQ